MRTTTRKRKHATPEQQVHFAVKRTPHGKSVRVPVDDLMFVYRTLGELVRFFHQPSHWTTLADVERFIGDRRAGVFRLISESYYRRVLSPTLGSLL